MVLFDGKTDVHNHRWLEICWWFPHFQQCGVAVREPERSGCSVSPVVRKKHKNARKIVLEKRKVKLREIADIFMV